MFALAITLVVFVSTALLIYQYWSGSLMPAADDAADTAARPETIERVTPADVPAAMDTAA